MSSTKVNLKIEPAPGLDVKKQIEYQDKILANEARRQVIVAHRRFGKTTTGLLKILKQAKKNTRFWHISPTYRQGKMIAWDMLNKLIPFWVVARKNEVELFLELINGCKIELKGSDNPDTLRGSLGLDGVIFDEFALQNPSIYTEIIRPALADKQGWALFIGTPKGKNHFFDLFMATPETDRYLLKASDTNIISQEELDIAKKEMSEDEYLQEFECGFLYFSGQIYKEFKRDIHIAKPREINEMQGLIYASIDYGQVNPTACLWFQIDYDGNIFVIDEYYVAGKTIDYHVSKIKNRYTLRTSPYLDPSAFAKNRSKAETMYSIADEFADAGMPCVPAPNDVLGGINRIKEYFQKNKLFICANCEKTIWELENYRWKDKPRMEANLIEEPLKLNDHLCDALRYFILSRPQKPTFQAVKNPLVERYKYLTSYKKPKESWYD